MSIEELRPEVISFIKALPQSQQKKQTLILLNVMEQQIEKIHFQIEKIELIHKNEAQQNENLVEHWQGECTQLEATYQSEKNDLKSIIVNLENKASMLEKEIITIQQKYREENDKFQEKIATINEQDQHQQNIIQSYSQEFHRLQNALQEAYEFIEQLQTENQKQKIQITYFKIRQENMNSKQEGLVNIQRISQESDIEEKKSNDSNRSDQCLVINNSRFEQSPVNKEKLQESFEYIRRPSHQSLENQKTTLKDMLDVSLERNYKIQQYMFSEPSSDKENQQPNKHRQKGFSSKSNKEGKKSNIQINQFEMVKMKKRQKQQINPYYVHFLIICQNAKINSHQPEQSSKIELNILWEELINTKIPMHIWGQYVEKHLVEALK